MAIDSFNTAKGQKAFQAELKYAADHHHYPGEHKHAEPPPLPKTAAQPAAKKSYSVADAAPRGADNKSLALRVNHPEHRDDLSKMFHQYAINHSANPYTSAEKQHNANIYGYVKKAYGKDTADDMHRHAEAMRTNDVYGIRAKYNIQEAIDASDGDLWSEHQRRYNANSSHSHVIAKAIEDEISKRHGPKSAKDMVAHSVLYSLGHNEPTRALIRRKNGITLTEASMAKRELVPNQELAMDRATYKNLKKQDGLPVARQMNANRKAILSQLSTNVKR